jgi:Fe-S-cluster containining protein
MIDTDNGDVVNQKTPCQWLNLKDNKCDIYEVRPLDCSGFPHHTKKQFDLYNHVYEQNLDKCPATYKLIEKMEKWVEEAFVW